MRVDGTIAVSDASPELADSHVFPTQDVTAPPAYRYYALAGTSEKKNRTGCPVTTVSVGRVVDTTTRFTLEIMECLTCFLVGLMYIRDNALPEFRVPKKNTRNMATNTTP